MIQIIRTMYYRWKRRRRDYVVDSALALLRTVFPLLPRRQRMEHKICCTVFYKCHLNDATAGSGNGCRYFIGLYIGYVDDIYNHNLKGKQIKISTKYFNVAEKN